ncbi:MAG: FecR domain-containing protein [Saprospiraceae bacterium]|nr:FecR domain-containing protein [Saprospiraceae bacterium]
MNREEKNKKHRWSVPSSGRIPEDELNRLWKLTGTYRKNFEPDADEAWNRFRKDLDIQSGSRYPRLPLRPLLAAVLALLLAAMLWVFVFKPADELIYLTETGEQLQLELPDGTVAQLNENSRLRLPRTWVADSRELWLTGEAFFEVAKEDRPLYIHTQNTRVEVLGTAFNLRAYEDESFTEVEVSEGKVKFEALGMDDILILEPGEMGVCIHHSRMFKRADSGLNFLAWKTGELNFVNTPIDIVFESVERYYGVDFVLPEGELPPCRYTANFDREPLEVVLKDLSLGLDIDIQSRTNGKIVLRDINCR